MSPSTRRAVLVCIDIARSMIRRGAQAPGLSRHDAEVLDMLDDLEDLVAGGRSMRAVK